MPNNSINWGIDLLPDADLTYNLGKIDANNSTNNRRWNIFGNLTGSVTGSATSWTNAQTTYVNLASSGTDSTLNGGQSSAQVLKVNGILSVSNGGTGQNSLTSGYALIGDGTNAVNFRQIINNESATAIAADITNDSLVTVNTVYYGLPTINNSHNYTSSTTIYAPVGGGTENHILIGKGATTAPDWTTNATLSSNSTGDLLTLGASSKQGKITLYSSGTTTTTIEAQSGYTKTFYLPQYDDNMYAVHAGDNNAVGSVIQPVYVAANGRVTVMSPVQYTEWEITQGKAGVTISSSAFTTSTYVLSLVITSGESYLNSSITWSSDTNGSIVLSTDAVNGKVEGYIITAQGIDLTNTTDLTIKASLTQTNPST